MKMGCTVTNKLLLYVSDCSHIFLGGDLYILLYFHAQYALFFVSDEMALRSHV